MSSAGNEKKPEYIERERAKEHLIADTAYAAAKMLDEIPAADVAEVKHGEWINIQNYGGGKCFGVCSNCGEEQKAPNPTALKMFRKYCSYCGAKIDGATDTKVGTKKEGAASV